MKDICKVLQDYSEVWCLRKIVRVCLYVRLFGNRAHCLTPFLPSVSTLVQYVCLL